jgi:hypothetical protein
MEKISVNTSYQFLLVKDLRLGNYQRKLDMPKVKKMADEFDETLLGTISVSKRNGQYFVIDGQHRVILAKTKGLRGLMALIYEGFSYEEEAILFNRLNNANGEQKRLRKTDIFRASVEAKDVVAIDIKNIVESVGFRISETSAANTIAAVNTIIKIYKRYGGQGLHDVLKLSKDTWNGEKYSLNNMVLEGMAEFLNIYSSEPNFSIDSFINQLSKVDSIKVLREAKGDNTTNYSNIKMMNTLIKYYNLRLRKKLQNKHYSIG